MSGISVGNLAALWAGGLGLGYGWPRIGAAIRHAWEKIHT